jgi:hypothetical protein
MDARSLQNELGLGYKSEVPPTSFSILSKSETIPSLGNEMKNAQVNCNAEHCQEKSVKDGIPK